MCKDKIHDPYKNVYTLIRLTGFNGPLTPVAWHGILWPGRRIASGGPLNWLVTFFFFFALWLSVNCLTVNGPQSYDYPSSMFPMLVCRSRTSSSLGPVFRLSDNLSYLHLVYTTQKKPPESTSGPHPIDGARGDVNIAPRPLVTPLPYTI